MLGDDADGAAAETGEADHHIARPLFVDLEKLSVVDDTPDDLFHIVGTVGIVGHDRVQLFILAQQIVGGRDDGRIFHIVVGQIAHQLLHDEEGVFLIFGGEVGDAGLAAVDRRAAQLLKGDLFMGDCFDHIGSGDEHVTCVFDHDDEVGDGGRVDGSAGAGPHNDADLRDDAGRHDIAEEDVGVAGQAEHAFLDTCAAGVVQADDGGAVFHGHIEDFADLGGVMAADAASEDGEVLRKDVDEAVVNCAEACDNAVAGDALLVEAEVVAVVGDQRVDFAKAAFIQHQLKPLAGGGPAFSVLNLDPFKAAPEFGHVFTAAQIGDTRVDCRVSQDKLLYPVIVRFADAPGILPAGRGKFRSPGVSGGPLRCQGMDVTGHSARAACEGRRLSRRTGQSRPQCQSSERNRTCQEQQSDQDRLMNHIDDQGMAAKKLQNREWENPSEIRQRQFACAVFIENGPHEDADQEDGKPVGKGKVIGIVVARRFNAERNQPGDTGGRLHIHELQNIADDIERGGHRQRQPASVQEKDRADNRCSNQVQDAEVDRGQTGHAHDQGEDQSDTEYVQPPARDFPTQAIGRSANGSRPIIAENDRNAGQCDERGGGETLKVEPEAFMQYDRQATEVAQVEHQMKDDHGDDGHAAPAVDLPEAGDGGGRGGRDGLAGVIARRGHLFQLVVVFQ